MQPLFGSIEHFFAFLPDFPSKGPLLLASICSFLVGIVVSARCFLSAIRMQTDPQALIGRGDQLARKGDFAGAKEVYLSVNALAAAAKMAQKMGQMEEAAKLMLAGRDYQKGAEILISLGRHADAAWAFEQLKKPLQAGEQWELAGNLGAAADKYREAGSLRKLEDVLRRQGKVSEIADIYAKEYAEVQAMLGSNPKQGQNEKARGLANRAAKTFMEAGEWKKAADIFLQANETFEAAKALEAGSQFARAADLMQQAGKLEEAARLFIKAEKYELAAELYVDMGRTDEVPALFERAGQKEEARLFEARLYLERGELGHAADLFAQAGEMSEAARLYSESSQHAKAGPMWEACGETEKAANAYREAQVFAKAAPLFVKLERFEDAGFCFEHSEQPVEALRQYVRAKNFYAAGKLAYSAGDLDGAISYFQKVPPASPQGKETAPIVARLFTQRGMFELAKEKYQQLCVGQDVNRDNLELFYDYANFLEQTGDAKKGGELYDKILSLDFHFKDALAKKKNVEQLLKGSSSQLKPGSAAHSPGLSFNPVQGKVFADRYDLTRQVGAGGMGVIYLAQDRKLGRPVALKFLPPSHTGGGSGEKFLREARIAAQLVHPNIISVFDVGQDRGNYYIVMEYVDGPNLLEVLQKSKWMSLSSVKIVADQVSQALAYAHGQNVVHRDVKSSNLLLTKEKLIKVADFGLAKRMETAELSATQTMGSPLYMAPEQILGSKFDHRVDLYALGIVLYELLTGRPPFTEGEVTYHHLHTVPPSIRSKRDEVPEAMEAAILKLLAKDPLQRFASAGEFLKAWSTL